jgi:hypothetical protein
MFDLQIDKKKNKCLKWIKVVKKNHQHIVKIFYMLPTIYRTRGEHANHYATDAVPYFYFICIHLFNQNFLLSFNILFENKN